MKIGLKGRNVAVPLILLVLLVCLTAQIAFAYFNGVTGAVQNVFTFGGNIRARLIEPNWNEEEGLRLVPGKTVPKDPMITNMGEMDEYVAIRLTFQYEDGTPMADGDLKTLLNLLYISWNDDWTVYSGLTMGGTGEVTAVSQPITLYYNQSLGSGEVSAPVFSSIRVKDQQGDGLTEAQLRWLQGIKIEDGQIVPDSNGIGNFHIKVEGAAVQAEGYVGASNAVEDLNSLFPIG